MALTQTLEVSLIGASLALRYTDDATGTHQWEYHPVCRILSITGVPIPNFGAIDTATMQRKNKYKYDDMLRIRVELDSEDRKEIQFDLTQVTNQAGWTLDVAGVDQALLDINGWAALCISAGGGRAGLATEATLSSLNTKFTAVERTPSFDVVLGVSAVAVPAGARSVSFFNPGPTSATIDGDVLASGESVSFSAGGEEDTLAAISVLTIATGILKISKVV